MTVAVGIYAPRKRSEVELLRRAVYGFGVDFTFQVGGFTAEGLPGTPHHIFGSLDRLATDFPGLAVVALELDSHAIPLSSFQPPQDVAYLLGPNTGTLPKQVLDRIGRLARVETPDNRALASSSVAAVVLHHHYVTLTHDREEAA